MRLEDLVFGADRIFAKDMLDLFDGLYRLQDASERLATFLGSSARLIICSLSDHVQRISSSPFPFWQQSHTVGETKKAT